jgi:type IV pilus assembly protein PilA
MRSEWKHGNRGFTLIELLLFVTMNGLLAAIALPSFLSQANKAKQAEAKNFVGTMNRAQQAYYLERGSMFARQSNFKDLGIGNKTQTENYSYQIIGGGPGSYFVTNQASQKKVNSLLKAYVGGVSAMFQRGTRNVVTQSVLCEADKSAANGGMRGGMAVYSVSGPPLCPANMRVIYNEN